MSYHHLYHITQRLIPLFVFLALACSDTTKPSGPSGNRPSRPVTWRIDHPGPTGPPLRDIHLVADDYMLAVGDGPTLLEFDGSSWKTVSVDRGTITKFNAVWAFAATNIYIVGTSADAPVLHYDGSSWTQVSPGAGGTLVDIWGSGPSDVFVLGEPGIFHFDGSAWSKMTTPGQTTMNAVWGTTGNDVFAVGEGGSVIHYDGTAWSPMSTPVTAHLYAVWGLTANDIYAGGQQGAIIHYDGAGWNEQPNSARVTIRGIAGDGGAVYTVGDDGMVLSNDLGGWRTVYVAAPFGVDFTAISSLPGSAAGVRAVGVNDLAQGVVYGSKQGEFSNINSVTTKRLYDIWGAAGNDVFVAGATVILHRDADNWADMNAPAGRAQHYTGIWGSAGNDVFAVGSDSLNLGCIAHYDGAGWSEMAAPQDTPTLMDVWGTGPNDIYAVGSEGTILHYGGAGWDQMSSPVGAPLSSVWAHRPGEAYAVGQLDGYLYYDGSTWTQRQHPDMHYGIRICGGLLDGSGEPFFYVASVDFGSWRGFIHRLEGQKEVEWQFNPAPNVLSMWATHKTRHVAYLYNDYMRRLDDASNEWVITAAPSGSFSSIFGFGDGTVYAVGTRGEIIVVDDPLLSP